MSSATASSRLRAVRHIRGLSQEDFGRLGGVTRFMQIRYENGTHQLPAPYLLRLAVAGIDVRYITSGRSCSLGELSRYVRAARLALEFIGGGADA